MVDALHEAQIGFWLHVDIFGQVKRCFQQGVAKKEAALSASVSTRPDCWAFDHTAANCRLSQQMVIFGGGRNVLQVRAINSRP
jgi:hypothetical protein